MKKTIKRHAQILNGRVHWIMESQNPPAFSPEVQMVNDIPPEVREGWLYSEAEGFSPPPGPSKTELMASLREQRGLILKSTDWTQMSDAPLTEAEKENWRAYRQALRDLPQNADPAAPQWPIQPATKADRMQV